jgi:hypothetical protein
VWIEFVKIVRRENGDWNSYNQPWAVEGIATVLLLVVPLGVFFYRFGKVILSAGVSSISSL